MVTRLPAWVLAGAPTVAAVTAAPRPLTLAADGAAEALLVARAAAPESCVVDGDDV
jgi:hypothetical protein